MAPRKLAVLLLMSALAGIGIPLALKKFGVIGHTVILQDKPETKKTVESPVAVSVPETSGGSVKPSVVYVSSVLPDKPQDNSPDKPLFMRGSAWLGNKLRVVLSDGRTLTEKDDLVAQVDSGGVTLKDGTRIWKETVVGAVPITPVAKKEPEVIESAVVQPGRIADMPAPVADPDAIKPKAAQGVTFAKKPGGHPVRVIKGPPRGQEQARK